MKRNSTYRLLPVAQATTKYFFYVYFPGCLLKCWLLFLLSLITNIYSLNAKDLDGGKETVNISATVVNTLPVKMTTLKDMDICGLPGEDDHLFISSSESIYAGMMRADGLPNLRIRLIYPVNEVIAEESGNGTLTIKYEMSGNNVPQQETSKLLDSGEAVFNLDKKGFYYLWIGGHINTSSAGAGLYKSEFTIEMEYF